MCVLVAQSCPALCSPTDGSPPASSVHGILQQEHWSGLPFPSPEDLPDPGIDPGLLLCRQILYHLSYREVLNNPFIKHLLCIRHHGRFLGDSCEFKRYILSWGLRSVQWSHTEMNRQSASAVTRGARKSVGELDPEQTVPVKASWMKEVAKRSNLVGEELNQKTVVFIALGWEETQHIWETEENSAKAWPWSVLSIMIKDLLGKNHIDWFLILAVHQNHLMELLITWVPESHSKPLNHYDQSMWLICVCIYI